MIRRATLFFEPLDVLQFRDHRPFDAGFNVTAESIFPMPSVFLGCVRTALLRMRGARFGSRDFGLGEPWRGLLGSPAEPGTLALRGPLLARLVEGRFEPLLPAPLDLQPTRDGLRILRPFRPEARRFHGRSAVPVDHAVPWTEEDPGKRGPPILTLEGARRYLTAAPGPVDLGRNVLSHDDVYEHETRVGIVRSEATLAAEDRMLYVTRPFRLEWRDWTAGFAIDVELPGDELNDAIGALHGRVVPLGGKGHRARIHRFDGPLLPDELTACHARKLWLVTPLPLASGPGGWPRGVACAATDRTVPIGGFDLAERAPKPLRRALPSGTVLWLEGITPHDALAALGGDGWETDRRAGYGAALAGNGTEDR